MPSSVRTRHHHLVVIVHAVRRPRSAAHLPVHNHLHHLLIPVVDGDVILVVRKGKIDNLDARHLGAPSETLTKSRTAQLFSFKRNLSNAGGKLVNGDGRRVMEGAELLL